MGDMNNGETVLDGYNGQREAVSTNDPGETRLEQKSAPHISEMAELLPGQTISTGFVILQQLGTSGSQASIYTARKRGKQYIVKLYKPGYRPADAFIEALKGHDCPYLARLISNGFEDGCYYEVYDHYRNGTLDERGKCSLSYIKNVIVPNLNEGLHYLHTLGDYGIVHGDIKPSNIFISDDERSVLIGDFGISSYLDRRGALIDEIRGTPEYAPRTVAFFDKVTKTSAYDYGSLGLVLIKAATGHSLFEGLDTKSITSMWEEGISLPSSIDGRLKRLIAGLLNEDERMRFGYEEVKRWCEGEFVRISDNRLYSPEDFETKKEPDPYVFGVFGDRIVTVAGLNDLSAAICENWEHATKLLKRQSFYEFIGQFGEKLAQDARVISSSYAPDEAVFRILYLLHPFNKLVFKGIDYGSASEFIKGLDREITDDTQTIIRKGLLEYFLRQNAYPPNLLSQVHTAIHINTKDPLFAPRVLFYLFDHEKALKLYGKTVTTPEQFIDLMIHLEPDEIERAAQDSTVIAWLYSIGYKDDVLKLLDV